MVKEKTGTVVGGVFLSIGVYIFAGIGITLMLLGLTIFNMEYYKGLVTNDKMINVIYDGLEEEAGSVDGFFNNAKLNSFDGYDVSDLEFEDVITKEFLKVYISDVFDYAITQDEDSLSEDFYLEYFEEEMIPAIEDAADVKLTKKERKQAAKEIYKGFYESTIENFDTSSDSDTESIQQLFVAKTSFVGFGVGTLVLGLILAVIEIVIYKNKFRAVRNISIAMFVMGVLNLLTVVISKVSIVAMFNEIVNESTTSVDDEIVIDIIDAMLSGAFDKVIYTFLIISVISLAGIITFAILAKGYKSIEDDEPAQYKAPAAPVAPVIPVAQPEPVAEPVVEPVVEPVTEPVSEPVVEVKSANKVCPSCGYVGEEGEKFCQNCGTKLQ